MTAPPTRPLHPRHGVQRPRRSTPPLRPGLVRRTSSFDATRPHGLDGPLELHGRGRDLLVAADGAREVRDEGALDVTVDYLEGRGVTRIAATPPLPLDDLVGTTAGSGFRSAVEGTHPELAASGGVAHWLLDEVPVITLVSGFALSHARIRHPYTGRAAARPDLCAGWAEGATIMLEIRRSGRSPVPTGPDAPDLEAGAEAGAWHEAPPPSPHTVRRRRLLDVTLEGGSVVADVLFRDSHTAEDGHETVVHEYGARATVDPATWRVTGSGAVDEVLPWVECSGAVASAARLVGQDVRGLRAWVREELTGVSTCTHLNDTLRGLADVPHLAAPLLAGGTGTARPGGP